jgi:hypothetical protein
MIAARMAQGIGVSMLPIVLRPLYIALILMGFTIMGLGVARIFQESKRGRYY